MTSWGWVRCYDTLTLRLGEAATAVFLVGFKRGQPALTRLVAALLSAANIRPARPWLQQWLFLRSILSSKGLDGHGHSFVPGLRPADGGSYGAECKVEMRPAARLYISPI